MARSLLVVVLAIAVSLIVVVASGAPTDSGSADSLLTSCIHQQWSYRAGQFALTALTNRCTCSIETELIAVNSTTGNIATEIISVPAWNGGKYSNNVVPVPGNLGNFNQVLVGSTKTTENCWASLITCLSFAYLPNNSALWANTCQVDIAVQILLTSGGPGPTFPVYLPAWNGQKTSGVPNNARILGNFSFSVSVPRVQRAARAAFWSFSSLSGAGTVIKYTAKADDHAFSLF